MSSTVSSNLNPELDKAKNKKAINHHIYTKCQVLFKLKIIYKSEPNIDCNKLHLTYFLILKFRHTLKEIYSNN